MVFEFPENPDSSPQPPRQLPPPPVPAPESAEWYMAHQGQTTSQPFTLMRVRQDLLAGKLPADALFWKSGLSGWLPAASIPELASVLILDNPESFSQPPQQLSSPPAPVPEPAEWYITHQGQVTSRPDTLTQVRQALLAGTLPADALFWKSGLAGWLPAASIPEMASVLPGYRVFEENGRQYLQLDLGDGVTMRLVYIHSGTFVMGSPESEDGRRDIEGPQTRVKLTRDFWLGETPVTQAHWEALIGKGNNPSWFSGDPNRPMEEVAWDAAKDFCEELTLKMSSLRSPSISGLAFTLPTEAQWEYACRAGSTSRFCFGDRYSMLGNYAWYDGNSNYETHPVKTKNPNAWGLYDMHGNVSEWCLDLCADLPGGTVVDPTGPCSGSYRVFRGGGWRDSFGSCRSAFRNGFPPDFHISDLGFRVAAVQ